MIQKNRSYVRNTILMLSGIVLIISFQNFSSLDSSKIYGTSDWGSCADPTQSIFDCNVSNYKIVLERAEKDLPPIDMSIVKLNKKRKVTFISGERFGPSLFGTSFLLGQLVYSAGKFSHPNTARDPDPKYYSFYPVSKAVPPSNWEFIDQVTGEFILPDSRRKIVRMISGRATTRDNKLYNLNTGRLLAEGINPYTLTYRHVSGLNNKVYRIEGDRLTLIKVVSAQLENPTVIEDSSLFQDQPRICSINANQDYFCTGVFGILLTGNSLSGKEDKVKYYGTDQTYLIANNVCYASFRLDGIYYTQKYYSNEYVLLKCDKTLVQEGINEWRMTDQYGSWASEATFLKGRAPAYKGKNTFTFVGSPASTPSPNNLDLVRRLAGVRGK